MSGHSGVGKTSLIHAAQQGLDMSEIFYVSGKFDQVNKFIPYSAFLQAAAELMKRILAMDSTRVELYRQKLVEVLGVNAQVSVTNFHINLSNNV